jgi:hypothetical protein
VFGLQSFCQEDLSDKYVIMKSFEGDSGKILFRSLQKEKQLGDSIEIDPFTWFGEIEITCMKSISLGFYSVFYKLVNIGEERLLAVHHFSDDYINVDLLIYKVDQREKDWEIIKEYKERQSELKALYP